MKRIFISISSYRDSDLINTIDDALMKATIPERIGFGVVFQGTRNEFLEFLPKTSNKLVYINNDNKSKISMRKIFKYKIPNIRSVCYNKPKSIMSSDCDDDLDRDGKEVDSFTFAAELKKGVKLNKPFRTPKGPKKFSVYVKNEKGNVVKVNFGDPNMEIKRDDPDRRKSFRARHKCDTNPGPKYKARYWSCRMWESGESVKDIIS